MLRRKLHLEADPGLLELDLRLRAEVVRQDACQKLHAEAVPSLSRRAASARTVLVTSTKVITAPAMKLSMLR